MPLYSSFHQLNTTLTNCKLCNRLVQYRENVPPRASFKDQTYWRKPLPGFGDPTAWLVIIGLAPAAHGGNRTGRIFTGDETSRFLMTALYEAGFANIPTSENKDDGLHLTGCYMTAAVKCAPPQNKPEREECINCSPYLEAELSLLENATSVLALGKLAFDAYLSYVKRNGGAKRSMKFTHGAEYSLEHFPTLYASYHPTQRNTFTGTLTKEMFSSILEKIKSDRIL